MKALQVCAAALVAGAAACATLPSVEKHIEQEDNKQVRFDSSRGPLTPQLSAGLLLALQPRGGKLDILQKHVAIEEAIVGTSLTLGNKATLLQDGPSTYAAMLKAMGAARHHINFETYIIEDDEVGRRFADMMIAKQAQGVKVNLIHDSAGTLGTPAEFFQRLREAGVAVLEFNPVNPLEARGNGWQLNHRDHRKLIVVDGRIAFIGGINIADAYSRGPFSSIKRRSAPKNNPEAGWRDTHVQIEGPVVADFQKLFMTTWTKQQGGVSDERKYFPTLAPKGNEVVRAVGSYADEPYNAIYLTLLSAIMHAEQRIWLTNAYFVPDPQLLEALTDAARRGVDVRLLLPGQSDQWLALNAGRSHYRELLQAGVRIHERKYSVLHSKTAVIDSVWSCVGSTNLDWRSFMHNNEVDAVVLGRDFALQMERMFESDQAQSLTIELKGWQRRPLLPRIQEGLGRLWEYWL